MVKNVIQKVNKMWSFCGSTKRERGKEIGEDGGRDKHRKCERDGGKGRRREIEVEN